MIDKLEAFARYLTKLKQYEKKSIFQLSDKSYELGTIGPGEIMGLDIMMSTDKLSLFTYQIVSERFTYITVPQMADQLLFDRKILESTLKFMSSIIQHRMDGLIKKVITSFQGLEDDHEKLDDSSLSPVEKRLKQLQEREALQAEVELLAAASQSTVPPLREFKRNKVADLFKNEQQRGSLDDPNDKPVKPVDRMISDYQFTSLDCADLRKEIKKKSMASTFIENMKRLPTYEKVEAAMRRKNAESQRTKPTLVGLKRHSSNIFDKAKCQKKLTMTESKTESVAANVLNVLMAGSVSTLRRHLRHPSSEAAFSFMKPLTQRSRGSQEKGVFMTAQDLKDSRDLPNIEARSRDRGNDRLYLPIGDSLAGVPRNGSVKKFRVDDSYKSPAGRRAGVDDGDRRVRGRHRAAHANRCSISKEVEFDEKTNTCRVVNKTDFDSSEKRRVNFSLRKIKLRVKADPEQSRRKILAPAPIVMAQQIQSDVSQQPEPTEVFAAKEVTIKESVSMAFRNGLAKKSSRVTSTIVDNN